MKRFSTFVYPIFTLLLLSFMLGACSPSKPTREDIIGLWVEHPVSGDNITPCGSFEFFEDGRFEAKDISREYFIPAGYDAPEQIDAEGTWELDTSSNDPFAVHRIKLLFSPTEWLPSSYGRVLYIALGRDLLYAGVDETVLFKKGERCNSKDDFTDN
jgi:hypothetical protein